MYALMTHGLTIRANEGEVHVSYREPVEVTKMAGVQF